MAADCRGAASRRIACRRGERLGMTFVGGAIARATARRGPVEVNLYWITGADWQRRTPPR